MEIFNTREETIVLENEYRQSFNALDKIIKIQNRIINSNCRKIIIDITNTKHIAPAFMVLIGTLPELRGIASKRVIIRYSKDNEKMMKKLSNHGVLQYYDASTSSPKNKSIPFCRIKSLEESQTIVKQILDCAPVQLSDKAQDTIQSRLYEIFINAETHGKNEVGTFCNGTSDINRRQFIFSIYDCGVGIKKNVNDFLGKQLSSLDAINWALTNGNSTSVTDFPRGAGFTLLEKFINLNHGSIMLCSDNIVCKLEKDTRKFFNLSKNIQGTLFIMNITSDKEYTYIVK